MVRDSSSSLEVVVVFDPLEKKLFTETKVNVESELIVYVWLQSLGRLE